MLTFHTQYRPITSRPFLGGPSYMEYEPCEELRPYVACYWATGLPLCDRDRKHLNEKVLVIPDTCVDIIIEINESKQKISCRLCGLQDYPVMVNQNSNKDVVSKFAVRFHFWSAFLFLRFNMKDIYNRSVDLELVCPGCTLEFEPLLYMNSIEKKIAWMEGYLQKKIDGRGFNSALFNSIDKILKTSGRAAVTEICEYSCVSLRQMERIFQREVGISIKRTASLVRYQNVWREIAMQKDFHVQEAVYRYGYTDQSHLLNEFKRFHGLTPDQAKRKALACR